MFGSFKKTMNTIAQITLVCILLPFVAVVISAINGFGTTKASTEFIGFLSSLPMFDVWLSLWGNFELSKRDITAIATLSLTAYASAFTEAMITSIAVHFCNSMKRKMKIPGIDLFSTFLGLCAASFLLALYDIGSEGTALMLQIGTIFIMLIGLQIMISGRFKFSLFSTFNIFVFIIDSLLAVISCGFITKLAMIANGNFSSLPIAIRDIFVCAIAMMAAVFIAYFIANRND